MRSATTIELLDEIEAFKTEPISYFDRNVFIYWHSGLKDAPGIVQLAEYLASYFNHSWNVVFLHEGNLHDYFPYKASLFSSATIELRETLFSDVLRCYLICKYGGVWVDASCLVVGGFSEWLEGVLAEREFYLFKYDKFPDRVIMSWFMAGKKQSHTIAHVLSMLVQFITKERSQRLELVIDIADFCDSELIGPTTTDMRAIRSLEFKGRYPYFVLHYIWNELAKSRPEIWYALATLPEMPERLRPVKFDRRQFSDTNYFELLEGRPSLSIDKINADPRFSRHLKGVILSTARSIGRTPESMAPRRVFVDCGSNLCKVLEDRIQKRLDDEFYAFEPQPELSHIAAEVSARHPEISLHFQPKAIWVRDEPLSFFLATRWGPNHKGGSTLMEGHTRNGSLVDYAHPVIVQGLDFSDWLRRNFRPDDHVVIKMDIEGAEYPVLEKLVQEGTIDLVDELIVEFHQEMSETIGNERHEKLVQELKRRTKVSHWH